GAEATRARIAPEPARGGRADLDTTARADSGWPHRGRADGSRAPHARADPGDAGRPGDDPGSAGGRDVPGRDQAGHRAPSHRARREPHRAARRVCRGAHRTRRKLAWRRCDHPGEPGALPRRRRLPRIRSRGGEAVSRRIERRHYADLYGPTTGDRVRLGDTALIAEVERDLTSYG